MAHYLNVESLSKRYNRILAIDNVSFSVGKGEFACILGPSGCGKSTTLRCIAGLEKPDAGKIVLNGELISSPERMLPPEKRGMGFVFQSYALWPHKSVFDNIAFGLRIRHVEESEVKNRVREALRLVGMEYEIFKDKRPTELSGGEQQRVAIARSLVYQPTLLLLDEPFSNLDLTLRDSARKQLKSLHADLNMTVIMVTHDPVDAMALADRVIIMNSGKVVESGDPHRLYDSPGDVFTASFFSQSNIMTGVVEEFVTPESGKAVVRIDSDDSIRLMCGAVPRGVGKGAVVYVSIKAEDIRILGSGEHQSGANVFHGIIKSCVWKGVDVQYEVDVNGVKLAIRTSGGPRLRENDSITVLLPPEKCTVYAKAL